MDDAVIHYGAFLLATFAGAVVSGLAGFAFAPIIASIWLHILTPVETVTLIAGLRPDRAGRSGPGGFVMRWTGGGSRHS